MSAPVPAELFERSITQNGRRIGLILPTIAALAVIAGQYFFTEGLDRISLTSLLIIVTGLSVLLISDVFIKDYSKLWRYTRAFHWTVIHGLAIYGVGFLLPLPSPYLLLMMLIAALVYMELGNKAMLVSVFGSFGVLTGRFLAENGLTDPDKVWQYFATYSIMLVMVYYSIIYLKIAEHELGLLAKDSADAQAQQKQLESLINNISDGVIAVDGHNRVIRYNSGAMDVLDVNTDIKGKRLSQLLKPIDAESNPVSIAKLLKETLVPTINRDLRIEYADGSKANLYLGIAPVYLGYGKSVNNGYTILLRDITREKSLEEERDEFISVVSHELRTPIAISEGNISNAEFIAEKSGDMNAVKAALKESHNQVLFLAAMINDLSTLSRAERGVLEVEPETINVKEFGDELLKNYTPEANKKGLELQLEIDPSVDTLQSGKLYVREVLQNFITNAIKYTEKGSVTIGAKPGKDGVTFYVRDTGIGISKGDQERVFDKFFRSEDFRTRQNNGTGLGLYVTMKLTKLLHAEIGVESTLNEGSTFTIYFPNFK